ncbi:hypothetical protein CEXT_139561 [Caerostris extrusa]|uniref:Uncharacterized protein n=1 Tax=Caerostris extrusa TaxID=172846 RepID=A0AAV4XI61_CAEEX|nr:hypothetical protein CEXT_139561 [Caerostris extrusa]
MNSSVVQLTVNLCKHTLREKKSVVHLRNACHRCTTDWRRGGAVERAHPIGTPLRGSVFVIQNRCCLLSREERVAHAEGTPRETDMAKALPLTDPTTVSGEEETPGLLARKGARALEPRDPRVPSPWR